MWAHMMNMMGGQGWGWTGMGFGMFAMALFWVLVLAALIALGVAVAKWFIHQGVATAREKTAIDVLGERYARGEIGRDEFEQKMRDLAGWVPDWRAETFVIEHQGRIAYKQIGPVSPEMPDKTILPLVRRLNEWMSACRKNHTVNFRDVTLGDRLVRQHNYHYNRAMRQGFRTYIA